MRTTITTVSKRLLTLGLVLGSIPIVGQTMKAKNALYVEIGGNTGLYSINFDRVFYQKEAFAAIGRVGVSLFPQRMFDQLAPMLPLEIVGLIGRQRHRLETGIGITPLIHHASHLMENTLTTRLEVGALASARLGYRYQKPEGGFLFRVGFTPMLNLDSHIVPFAGVSIGKSF